MCYHPPANVFLVTRHPFCAGTFQEGDTMQILILFVVLAMIPGLLQAQATCKELQPTLHDYRVAEHGESYLAGRLALRSFSDSEEVCEKLRQDASVYMCRFRQAKATAESSARLAKNMLAHVRNRMSLNPRQVVGGEAANRGYPGVRGNRSKSAIQAGGCPPGNGTGKNSLPSYCRGSKTERLLAFLQREERPDSG